ncbi:MAG: division/cell wall cluster transcriptional repressor MraZ [Deltaproteobacteria bacterium]|nr:MAG: division/cell wall cluster transcriptional repressor MraZ [Deltaproteobacteria bacterium]
MKWIATAAEGIAVFQGIFQHSIDAKGRTSLPAKFREQLAAAGTDKLFITRDLIDPCLIAFAPERWAEIARKVSSLSLFDKRTRLLSRGFIAPAQECVVDKLGRVLIPPSLRERLGNVEEITWAGQTDRIEIWAPRKWAEIEKKAEAEDEALLKQLSELL